MNPLPESARRQRAFTRAAVACALLVLVALYLPLATNPGWFSHDEQQWNLRAQSLASGDPAWVAWSDVSAFQWRPLTFNLWLLLAWLGDGAPAAMHPVWIALGAGISLLLWDTLRALRLPAGAAAGGALAFAATPFAVFVHGWVATLADLLWVGLGLLAVRAVLASDPARWTPAATITLLATTLALAAKEAALALAPLAWLAWWLSARERRWLGAALGASLPTALYLALRLPTLMQGSDSAYAWSLTSVPARWLETLLWPFLPTMIEPAVLTNLPVRRTVLATLLLIGLTACAWRASWRIGAALLLGGALSLGPALTLAFVSPQYGYAHAAVSCAALAAAWPRLRRPGHALLLFALLVSTWHAFNVQRGMRRVGEIEAVFTPSLQQAVATAGDGALRLRVERATDAWIYRRLSVPADASRAPVVIVDEEERATHVVRADGEVTDTIVTGGVSD